MASKLDISGKVALVNGANRGIGKAIVDSFIEAGATKVYAAVRSLESAAPLINDHGERIVPIELDVTKPEQIAAAAGIASDVDVVVNNAGVLRSSAPLADDVEESFAYELDVNVYGLLRMAKAFAPVLKQNGGGAFVQLNSVASYISFHDFSSYCASKAASYSFTQALRGSFAEQGTQVLSVHPGPIQSDMAVDAGFTEVAEPASLVGDGIVSALKEGAFHLYPDTMAKDIGGAYQGFADGVVLAEG